MASDLEIRAYRPGDEGGLVDLFDRCFPRGISVAHWVWKLKSAPADYENVYVVTCRGRYVGQYVGVPVDVSVKGERRKAIVILDTMVDPSMRRQGVLTKMGRHAHERWRSDGVHFGFGLPNQQWGSRAAALGWEPLFELRWLIRVLRAESLLARRLRVPALRRLTGLGAMARTLVGRAVPADGVTLTEIDEAHADLDLVADAAANPDVISLIRDAAWVERRYLSCPSEKYRVVLARRDTVPVGYAVYKFRGGEPLQTVITEVVTASADVAARRALIAGIEQRSLAAGAESMLALAVPDTAEYRHWKACGFLPRRAAFLVQYVPMHTEMRDLRAVSDWHLEGGDFDVV